MHTYTYIIIRHGSNAANQPMQSHSVLGTVEAESREKAKAIAPAALAATVYANQWLEAIPSSKAQRADLDAASEADTLAEIIEEHVGCVLCGCRAPMSMPRRVAATWRCDQCR